MDFGLASVDVWGMNRGTESHIINMLLYCNNTIVLYYTRYTTIAVVSGTLGTLTVARPLLRNFADF